jgi:TonB family protein
MNGWLFRVAVAAVRLWTRVYTSGLPPATADARRAEVESDLWESAHDSDPDIRSHLFLQIAARLLIGIPDDLGWRLEQEEAMTGSFRRRLAIAVCTVGVVGLLLVVWLAQPPGIPAVHGAPPVGVCFGAVPFAPSRSPRAPNVPDGLRIPSCAYVPPPPPPPPGGIGADEVRFVFGETSYTAHGAAPTPQRVRDVPPVYPPVAVQAGVQGVVAVEAAIDERGRVTDARVVRSAHWVLDQSALNAVRQWEFAPAVVDGARIPVVITAHVNFSVPR